MLRFILQKLLNKKWLILSIIIGNVLLVGIACCNPMYSRAARQKMLTKNMNAYLEENNKYPGMIYSEATLGKKNLEGKTSRYIKSYFEVNDTIEEMSGIKAAQKVDLLEFTNKQEGRFRVKRANDSASTIDLKIATLSDLENHIEMVDGTVYSNQPDSEGIVDVIINEKVYMTSTIVIGDVLDLIGYNNIDGQQVSIRVVGVFRAKDPSDTYWVKDSLSYDMEFFMARDQFFNQFMRDGEIVGSVKMRNYTLFDYTEIDVEEVQNLLDVYHKLSDDYRSSESHALYKVSCNYEKIFNQFLVDSSKVNATMWILQVPILVLLAVFIFMVSNQVIGIEQSEIAMLKSRGVSRFQLILTYLLQSAIIGVFALIIGIPFGYLLCHLFGSTNAFMEFVGRKAMKVKITGESILYALISCLAGILIMTLPVLKFAKFSIVEQKSNKRKKNKPMWQKMFLDFVLLAFSCYEYYNFSHQKEKLMQEVANGEALDPLLFLSASLFILSCAIVFLRVIPLLSSLIFRIGRRFWKPDAYASFLQITRDAHKQSFITVFLVLTIALGIFNANIARTVNQNEEERLMYTDGADIVAKEKWNNNVNSVKLGYSKNLQYTEADYTKYEDLLESHPDELKAVTKVLHENTAVLSTGGKTIENVEFMAINTKEFGNTAWMPKNVTEHHWFDDLNALASNPEGLIVSSNLAEKYDLSVGTTMTLTRNNEVMQSMGNKPMTIVAIVDYWPGYENKRTEKDRETNEEKLVDNYLIVANYDNILLNYPITPYEIWMKVNDSTGFVYDWAESNNVVFTEFNDTTKDLINLKNDPYFQITNGMLTITFIVVLVLCAIGFLIFWITNIRSRELIFGIYRAMGMSMGELIRMLVNEHVFGSLLPIAFGAGVGIVASKLFLPLIQIAYSPKIETLPAKIIMSGQDLTRIGIVIAVMLFLCIGVLAVLLSKIKINQALKLGED